jgi:hypothetical protein
MGNKGRGGVGIFPWDASAAGSQRRDNSTHPEALLGTCTQPFRTRKHHSKEHSFTCRNHTGHQHVSQDGFRAKGDGGQALPISIRDGNVGTTCDVPRPILLSLSTCPLPGIEHWNALVHVVGYIKNTIDYGLTYSCIHDISPLAFVDADYGGC